MINTHELKGTSLFFVIGLVAAVLLIGMWQAATWARKATLRELRDEATTALQLQASTLQSELERRRSVPLVLAQDPDFTSLLSHPRNSSLVRDMNRKLESMIDGVGAAVLYVMDSSGSTLASSNWKSETSFVGHNFAFRPYFKKALLEGTGESFALGSVSQRSGFYVAHSVGTPGGVVSGVIVMKIQFDDLVEKWGRGSTHVIVTDENGVVLLADMTAWQLHTLDKLPDATAMAIRESMQFGDAELTPLQLIVRPAEDGISLVDGTLEGDEKGVRSYLKIATPIVGTSWKMHTLTPVEPRMSRQIAIAVLITALTVLAAATAMALWWYRRRQIRLQAVEQLRVMERLEELVRERTAELTRSNQKLHKEVEERERVESILRQAQGTLVHAEKLAALGQMAAGISHEVNQPLSAIRSYADNALVFHQRGRIDDIRGNLSAIAKLTERIGQIMQHLRDFARKASGKIEPVSLQASIEGSLALMAHRFRREKIEVVHRMPSTTLMVWGEQVRIEQVLVNLFQNAADAMGEVSSPRLVVEAAREGPAVWLTVADNGTGIDPKHSEHLFSPFFSTKEGAGLGLGLYISRGIIEEFGGTLNGMSTYDGGAVFELRLRAADEFAPETQQPRTVQVAGSSTSLISY